MSMRRTCCKCQIEKDLETEFYTHPYGKGGYQGKCKSCILEERKDQYAKNPQIAKNRLQQIRDRNRQFIWDFYSAHPCVDCEESDPLILELDHVRGEKAANVSQLVHNTRSLKVIEDEIAKCEVVCANCHRRRTAITQEWFEGMA